jgi:pimeloyl-ACP methyl ester carboxylesterase
MWYKRETGSGRPLILLHGLGMSHAAWNPVTPLLSPARRVIAFDIAGFGRTPPLVDGIVPTVANLVDGLEQSIQAMELERPVDIAGNSLGGYMALEAASRGLARTVVAISPAGLWREHPPPHVKHVIASMRLMSKTFPRVVRGAMRFALLRELLLSVPLSAGSRRMPVSDARRAVADLAASRACEATFEHTRAPFSCGCHITVPITVAFGERDWILPKGSWHRDRLPAHTRWLEPPGWGHVPMWVDPVGVAQLIIDGTSHGM